MPRNKAAKGSKDALFFIFIGLELVWVCLARNEKHQIALPGRLFQPRPGGLQAAIEGLWYAAHTAKPGLSGSRVCPRVPFRALLIKLKLLKLKFYFENFLMITLVAASTFLESYSQVLHNLVMVNHFALLKM
jgi:hypothetical protein